MLNSKAEWGGSKIPRLTVEVGARVSQQEYRGNNQQARKLFLPPPSNRQTNLGPSTSKKAENTNTNPDSIQVGGSTLPSEIARGRRRKRLDTIRDGTEVAKANDERGEKAKDQDCVEEETSTKPRVQPAKKRRTRAPTSGKMEPGQPSMRQFLMPEFMQQPPGSQAPANPGGEGMG